MFLSGTRVSVRRIQRGSWIDSRSKARSQNQSGLQGFLRKQFQPKARNGNPHLTRFPSKEEKEREDLISAVPEEAETRLEFDATTSTDPFMFAMV